MGGTLEEAKKLEEYDKLVEFRPGGDCGQGPAGTASVPADTEFAADIRSNSGG